MLYSVPVSAHTLFVTNQENNTVYYIQRKDNIRLETVDEFETYKEAKAMVVEYRVADYTANYYISSRCCKSWKEA